MTTFVQLCAAAMALYDGTVGDYTRHGDGTRRDERRAHARVTRAKVRGAIKKSGLVKAMGR